jgi:hypothetical protein
VRQERSDQHIVAGQSTNRDGGISNACNDADESRGRHGRGELRVAPSASAISARSPARDSPYVSYIDDLKVAHAASLMVDVTLVNGQTFFAGVQELDEAFGTVTLYAPKALSASAAQRIALSAIVSAAVMQIEWHPPNEIG